MVPRHCKGLRLLAQAGLALCVAAPLGGCSQPLLLFRGTPEPAVAAAEPATTGSIARPSLTFGADLNGEDWRRAQGALSLALDPQGNGRPVKWDNPDSGMHGSVNPTGLPYVAEDQICRNFLASVIGSERSRFVRGTGCKPSGGEWSLKRVHTAAAPARMPGEKGSEEAGPAVKAGAPKTQAAAKAKDEDAE
jgi:surface antigen